jgi:diadenosine tetraphosphate (Ap4A) HIT family hydrolase
MKDCLACDIINGKQELPDGRIYATKHWVVEHCVGPLGVGTLIVKLFRHCVHLWELNNDEIQELGPLLRKVANTISDILKPDQVYVCLWSHRNWEPVHIHFVLQPSWNKLKQKYSKSGPYMQVDMFEADESPPCDEVEKFAAQARKIMSKT